MEAIHSQKKGVAWGLPSRIREINEILGLTAHGPEALMANNTLVPALARFLTEEDAENLRNHTLERSVRGITGVAGLTGHVSSAAAMWQPAVCAECLVHDIAADYRPFWRRDFLWTHVKYCGKHLLPLLVHSRNCPTVTARLSSIHLPSEHCQWCGPLQQRLQRSDGLLDEVEVDFSLAWSQLLDSDELPTCNRKDMAKLMQWQLQILGITSHGRISWSRWRGLILSSPYGHATGIRLANDKCLRDLVLRGVLPRNLRQTILLLMTLFGGWRNAVDHFKNKNIDSIEIEPVIPRSNRKKYRVQKDWYLENRRKAEKNAAEYAAEYAEFRDLHPTESHTSLLGMLPHEFRYLTRQRLEKLGVKPAASRRGDEFHLELDSSLAAHIETTANALRETCFQGRLSRTRLCVGHRKGKKLGALLDRLPKTQAMLTKYEESEAEYRRRILRRNTGGDEIYFFDGREADYIDALADAEVIDRLRALYVKGGK